MMVGMTTEAKWSARVDAWRGSGLSARDFCEGKEYTASGLRYWSSRLGRVQEERKAQADAAPKEVRIARLVRTSVAAEAETPIVIEMGGARVGVRRGFDRGALRAILDVLGGTR
jgi:hypothetical protein